jgi:diacylglycerol kinase family enzyme
VGAQLSALPKMNVRATAPSAGSTGRPGLDEAPSGGWVRAEAPLRPVLFVNPRSGGGKAARVGLAERARERGIEAIVLGAGDDLRAVSRDAVAGGADALGMAGGDGSLVPVAEAAAANGVPFVPIPAGTRNHFALDVGADPGDLVGALDAFLHGFERNVDMAEVNGRTFLNNVSLGVYGEAVQRPGYRDAKIRTLLETARVVLGPGASAPALRLVDDAGREYQDPAVVLVSNNAYALEAPWARGARPALDSGRLGIVVLYPRGRARVLAAASWTAPSLAIDAAGPLHAGIDGEAEALTPPLLFVMRLRALRVRIAARHISSAPRGALARPGETGH